MTEADGTMLGVGSPALVVAAGYVQLMQREHQLGVGLRALRPPLCQSHPARARPPDRTTTVARTCLEASSPMAR